MATGTQASRRQNTHLDLQGNRLLNVGTLVPTPVAGTVLDFADAVDNVQSVVVSVAAVQTFTTTNLAPGRRKEVLLTTSLVAATQLAFPPGWIWYGSKLTATVLSKEIRLRLTCYGSSDADVRAEWIAQV